MPKNVKNMSKTHPRRDFSRLFGVDVLSDVIGELLSEWACFTLHGGTTFLLTSKLADILVSRVRSALSQLGIMFLNCEVFGPSSLPNLL